MTAFGFDVTYNLETEYKAKILIDSSSPEEAYAEVEQFMAQMPVPDTNKSIKRFLVYSQVHGSDVKYDIKQIEKATDDG